MVENSPSARPQWGLSTPDVVIEGVVEGGITRMMWLYADVNDIPKVGPTRSARHDYVELAEGFDAIYVHFGGSTYAYNTIKNDKVDDIDGMYDGKYFARDKSRNVASEHTAYTTGENLYDAINTMKIRTEAKDGYTSPFTFASEKRTLPGGACSSVLTVFSNSYKHTFKYNAEDGLYYNYMTARKKLKLIETITADRKLVKRPQRLELVRRHRRLCLERNLSEHQMVERLFFEPDFSAQADG